MCRFAHQNIICIFARMWDSSSFSCIEGQTHETVKLRVKAAKWTKLSINLKERRQVGNHINYCNLRNGITVLAFSSISSENEVSAVVCLAEYKYDQLCQVKNQKVSVKSQDPDEFIFYKLNPRKFRVSSDLPNPALGFCVWKLWSKFSI